MHLKISLRIIKKVVFIALAILILAGAVATIYVKKSNQNLLPSDVKDHVNFKVIYPVSKNAKIDKNSFVYQSKQKVLSFNVAFAGSNIAFSEQVAPDALGSGTQAYYPALGIHPYAQFKVKLGQVALTKFWQSGTLKPEGQSAVLVSSGTFLIAHSKKNLTNSEWKNLSESLKVTK